MPGLALLARYYYNLSRLAASPTLTCQDGAIIRNKMAERQQTIILCSCEDTMPLDVDAVRRGCRGTKVETAGQLCRAELERFRLGDGWKS